MKLLRNSKALRKKKWRELIEKRRSSLLEYFLTWILIRGFIDPVTWKYVIFGIWNFSSAMLELRAWNLERKETLCFKGQSNYSGLFCRTKRWSLLVVQRKMILICKWRSWSTESRGEMYIRVVLDCVIKVEIFVLGIRGIVKARWRDLKVEIYHRKVLFHLRILLTVINASIHFILYFWY